MSTWTEWRLFVVLMVTIIVVIEVFLKRGKLRGDDEWAEQDSDHWHRE